MNTRTYIKLEKIASKILILEMNLKVEKLPEHKAVEYDSELNELYKEYEKILLKSL